MLNSKQTHSLFLPTSDSADEADLRCPNCLYYFSSLTKPYYLPCSHNLCLDCIETLLSHKQWSTCPICSIPFTKESDNPFQVNLGFLTLVSNILKTKIIFCKKCNKVFMWNEHSSECDQSEFREVNEIICEVKTLFEKSISVLKYISYHYNIIQICKGEVYRTLLEAIKNINDSYRKKYLNTINFVLSDVVDVNFENAKNEICKFLETCVPCVSLFNIDENEVVDLIENTNNIKENESVINDDTKMNYKYKGNQVFKYQNNFKLKKDLKTSRSPFPSRTKPHKLSDEYKMECIKDESIVINNDEDSEDDDDQIPNEKETERGIEGVLKINNFNNPRVNDYRDNSMKRTIGNNNKVISNSNRNNKHNIDLYSSIFHDYNSNNVKVDVTDILEESDDVFNKKKQNKLVITKKGITKVKDNEHTPNEENNSTRYIHKKISIFENNEKQNNYYDNDIESSSIYKVKSPYNGSNFLNMQKLNTQNFDNLNVLHFTKNSNRNKHSNLHNVSSHKNIFKNNSNNNSITNNIRTSLPQNIRKNYNTFSIDLTNTSITTKKHINPIAVINKLNKTFNKIKDLITKINTHSFYIDSYSSKIVSQIENNNKSLSPKITSYYSSLLNDLSYSQNQTHKRYLLTFIPNTTTFHLYDAKTKSQLTKHFNSILSNNKLDISTSIAFDDTDLIFISGGKHFPNNFQIIRWSNSKCEINSKLKLKRSYHTSLYYQSKLYIIGGIGGTTKSKEEFYLRECETYSLVKQTWENMPLLNYPRANASCCVVNNCYLYVFRGSDRHNMLDTIEWLDMNKNEKRWTVFQPEDPGLSWFGCEYSCAVSYADNKVMVFGGKNNYEKEGCCYCFEFDTESKEIYRMKDIKGKAWFKDGCGTFLQNEVVAVKWSGKDQNEKVYVYNVNKNDWRKYS